MGVTPHFNLIERANRNDRYQLLEDPSILSSDLDISIHSVFQASNFINTPPAIYQNMENALRLASMFLQYDSTIDWFVSPLFGLPLLDTQTNKTYLSDPLASKTAAERRALRQRVRVALDCMAHSVNFQFYTVNGNTGFWARSLIDPTRRASHNSVCCTPHFKVGTLVRIDLRKQYWDFLNGDYASQSQPSRFRHEFSLAVSLIHEICHAVGILRRGNLEEPNLRLDHLPKSEFGYAWENFMFGCIINPFDRDSSSISFLMRKTWAENMQHPARRNKEWSAVPMSYISQWFRKSTWAKIARRGPSAIALPAIKLKLRSLNGHLTLFADSKDAVDDVKRLRSALAADRAAGWELTPTEISVMLTRVIHATAPELEATEIPLPSRHGPWYRDIEGSSAGYAMVRSVSDRSIPRLAIHEQGWKSTSALKRSAKQDGDESSAACEQELLVRPTKRVKQ
ncbi:hypothetical protein B0J11DRAFT_592175 [Dendryphion nanum]|uniref:Uncharacterized protein n=1 Tax=Dendryphion nanum TaxID=256645 RepID=A0A9P9DEJ5_9PLEO|nr:hypothetical protein B0J11DRAFT_592175 [Dendryphion nanum]